MSELPNQAISDSAIEQVGTAPNEIVADLWRQVLLGEGVVALLKPTGLGHAWVSNSLNPHQVYVRSDQAELARDVIASLSDAVDDSDNSDSAS